MFFSFQRSVPCTVISHRFEVLGLMHLFLITNSSNYRVANIKIHNPPLLLLLFPYQAYMYGKKKKRKKGDLSFMYPKHMF